MTVTRGQFFAALFLTIAGAFLGTAGTALYYRAACAPPPGDAAAAAKGDFVVVVVDDAAPTVAEGAVLDGPQFDGLRAAGVCAVRPLTWDQLAAKNYGPLVKSAGGCPALIVLTHGGEKAYAGKLPADEKAVQALLAKHLANCPPPLPPAPQLRVIDPGQPLWVARDGVPYVEVGGHKRFLAARPSKGRMAALLPRYADTHPVFPESQWRDIDRRNVFTWAKWGLDQDGVGSCVAQSSCSALAKLRYLHGMSPVLLSPGYLYSEINGGRDEGAVISDGMAALVTHGTCAFRTVGQKPYYAWQEPAAAKAEAPRFRLKDGYHCQTWEELGSALQTGRYLAVFGVQVGTPAGGEGNWGRFDHEGVAGHDRGPGNHALHADGMRKLSAGRWVLDVPNSWGGDWGPWHNGRVYLDKQHLFGGGDQPDVCVFRCPADDPKDPITLPVYAGKAAGPEVALAP